MKLAMTIDEALEFADEWSRGLTLYEGAQGWRVVCMLLAEEVRRRHGIGGELIAARRERDETGARRIGGGGSFNDMDDDIPFASCAIEHDVIRRPP